MSATTPTKTKAATKSATTAAKKKREAKQIVAARAHVRATFNNTMITITDMSGNTLAWSSGGAMGFKGNRKSTPFAAQIAGETVAKSAMEYGVKNLDVFVRGPGSGREAALRAIQATGLTINSIRDTTPVPHNGCRPKKRRRV